MFHEHLNRGRDYWEFDAMYGGFCVKKHRALQSYIKLYESRPGVNDNVCMSWRDNRERYKEEFCSRLSRGGYCYRVGFWLIENFMSPWGRRPKDEKNLWLWSGEPDVGKTSFLTALERYSDLYHLNWNTVWFDSYKDRWFSAWVIDEFTGDGVDWTLFNKICGNSGCNLPRRNNSDIYRRDRQVPLIVCSNYLITTVFSHARMIKTRTGHC